MKFKYVIRVSLLVLFVALLILTLISIFGQPKDSKSLVLGDLSSVQNDVKMTSKMSFSPEKRQLIVDITVETFQMPELISDKFFADVFLSNETGYIYPSIESKVEVLSDYQVKGRFTYSFAEPAKTLTLHLFDLDERRFNFKVPDSINPKTEK